MMTVTLPHSWKTQRLKYFSTYSLSSVDRRMSDITVNVCHYPDVYYKEKIYVDTDLPKGTCTEDEHRKFSIKQGDILITKDSESPHDIGIPCLIAEDLPNTVCGYHLGIIRCRNDICPGFVFRFLQSEPVKGYFFCESSGITRFGLGKSSVENLKVPLPPLAEQHLIARYLDKKTTQIDSLAGKLQKKVELLKEQRAARINEAVTKGLDPNVEMIFDMPHSWKTQRLKYFSTYSLSSVDRHIKEDEIKVSVCHYPDVYYKEKIYSDSNLPKGTCTEDEYLKFSIKQGDILITKDSESPDDIGIPCLIEEDIHNTVCGYHLGIIRCENNICSGFVFRFLQSNFVKGYFFGESSGITRFGLGKSSVENLEVLLPPLEEQKRISCYLDKKTEQTDSLVEMLNKKIELLKEYRQALISSVVTGKMRVTEGMI